MPQSATVAGSPSSSSLSSIRDELARIADLRTDDVIPVSESDVAENSQQHRYEHLQPNSHVEEDSCAALSHSTHHQPAACTALSQSQPPDSGRQLESDIAAAHVCHGGNMQIPSSNTASESSRDTPPASLPSPSDDCDGNGEQMSAVFLTAVADEQSFEGAGSGVRKSSNTSEMHETPTGLKQNRCYWWQPVGLESESSEKFGCCSCVEVMNNASLSLPAGYGKPESRDAAITPPWRQQCGVMWISDTGDYASADYSTAGEKSVAFVMPLRMSSSLTA